MRFFCDQMLADLGKWLRAAGHDTLIATEGMSDDEILKIAQDEDRVLISCDRHFLGRGEKVVILKENSIDELKQALKIDWLFAPFSRCLVCNSEFKKPSEEEILKQVPEDVRARSSEFWFCPKCNKVYWEGSHTRAMLEKLKEGA